MVHGLPRHILKLRWLLLTTNQSRWVANRSGPWRHINQNNRPSTNLSAFPNLNITQNGSTSTNEHPISNLGMPIPTNLSSPAQCYMVQDRHIISNHRRLTHHYPCSVVKQNPFANPRCRVDIHCKYISDTRM